MEAGAESTFGPEPVSFRAWHEASNQAISEMHAGGHDWAWWSRRRRELVGYPADGPDPAVPVPLPWDDANRQANRERSAGGHDWRWWDRRRRELAGWPEEGREQWANRAAWVDVLATGARPRMPAWDERRAELLGRGGGGTW